MFSEANLQLIRKWVETIWNEAQFDQLPRFHPPVFDNRGNPATSEETRPWHVSMRATYPDLHYTIDDIFSAGDRVALRWTATGTQRGSLWGLIPATDKTVTWSGIHLLRVADDQIVEPAGKLIVLNAPKVIKAVKPDGVLWIGYAKGTSKAKTDVNRDRLWQALEPTG